MFPLSVDFPASTWPMKTRFRCSRGSPSTAWMAGSSLMPMVSMPIPMSFTASTRTPTPASAPELLSYLLLLPSSPPAPRSQSSPPHSSSSMAVAAAPSPEVAAMRAATSGYSASESGSAISLDARSRSPPQI